MTTSPTFGGASPDAASTSSAVAAEFGRTTVASAVATAFDFVLSVSVDSLAHPAPWLSTALGSVAGGGLNYGLNRRWSFESAQRLGPEAARYVVVSSAAAVANSVGVDLAVRAGADYPVAWLAIRALTFLGITFPLLRGWVFRSAYPLRLECAGRSLPALPGHAWLYGIALAVFALGFQQGFRTEYMLVALAYAACATLGPASRRLATLMFPVALVGLIYDNLEPVLALRGTIHISNLYSWELALFGISTGAGVVLPSRWLAEHATPTLDFFAGFSYLAYLYETFGVVLWLHFRRDPARARMLAWGFLAVNLIGIAGWVVFPAAPPWYVELYGLGPPQLDVPASAAGAARFDALVGVDYFQGFYARSRNVFGAMPSLHVAYPTLVAIALRDQAKGVVVGAVSFALLVAFAAVYLEHHYILDVVAGVIAALMAAFTCGLWGGTRRRPTQERPT